MHPYRVMLADDATDTDLPSRDVMALSPTAARTMVRLLVREGHLPPATVVVAVVGRAPSASEMEFAAPVTAGWCAVYGDDAPRGHIGVELTTTPGSLCCRV